MAILLPPEPASSGEANLHVGLAGAGSFRWAGTDLTALVQEAHLRLDLGPLATAALGRSMAAAAMLLRLATKMPARLVLELRGDGPLRLVLAEADAEGNLRGMVGSPRAELPTPTDKIPVGAGIGRGILRVVRQLDGSSYASQVAIQSGEVGQDVAHYLEQSEQIRSAVLLGVLARPGGVAGAGGLLIEVLPGARDEDLQLLESNLSSLGGISNLIAGGGLAAAADRVFDGLVAEVHETQVLRYRCRCNRERLLQHIQAMPEDDRLHMRLPDGGVEAECVFCGTKYRFTDEEMASPAEASSPD